MKGDDRNLIGKASHSLDSWVTVLLVYVMKGDDRNLIGLADLFYWLVDLILQLWVQNEVDIYIRMALTEIGKQLRQGRTETVEVGTLPVAVLVIADRGIRPTVVRSAANQDDVRIAQQGSAVDEWTVAVILIAVAGVADGGTGIGIDVAHLVTTFLDNLPPPGLLHLVDIGCFLNRSGVPGGISFWDETLESWIRVAEHGNGLLHLCHKRHQGEDKEADDNW